MEPTRNAWVPLAAWLGARGATVVLVAPERSADLRDYYAKHTKTDRLDSRMLARLPLLHPQDLEPLHGLDPAGTFKRTVRRRWSLVERRHACCQRLDALVEMLGPSYADVLGATSGRSRKHKAGPSSLSATASPTKSAKHGGLPAKPRS